MFTLEEVEDGKFFYRCQACGWQCEFHPSDRMTAFSEALAYSQSHKCPEPELASNQIENAEGQKERIQGAIRTFASAIGCEMTIEGGKQFARVVMVALVEAAFEGGDIYERVARKLLTFRSKK